MSGKHQEKARARAIAVASGKGGVGKTHVVANVAVALARRGKRVVVLDADLGLGNVDALVGLHPRCTLRDVLQGECAVEDAVVDGPAGVRFVPAASGHEEMTRITAGQASRLLAGMEALAASADVLLIDSPAGLSANVLFFAAAAGETLIVTTPEPTALTDAYALVKVLAARHGTRRFDVLVNLARDPGDAARAFSNVARVAARFLGVELRDRGFLPQDAAVGEAVRRQRLLLDFAPGCAAGRAIERLAAEIACEAAPARSPACEAAPARSPACEAPGALAAGEVA